MMVRREIVHSEIQSMTQKRRKPKSAPRFEEQFPALDALHPAIKRALMDAAAGEGDKLVLQDMAALATNVVALCKWCGEKAWEE